MYKILYDVDVNQKCAEQASVDTRSIYKHLLFIVTLNILFAVPNRAHNYKIIIRPINITLWNANKGMNTH